MPKLRRLAGRDVLTILHGFGFLQVSQRGSHVKLVREVAESRQVLTVPLLPDETDQIDETDWIDQPDRA
jgi:predicted RNA binding protein YcfA (HicA-like mRNA interferase family)